MGGAQRDNELHFLPLPLGEVAERSEDGEGKWMRRALSVTFGDSSPRGRAKGLDMLAQEMEHIDADTLHFPSYDHPLNCRPFFSLDNEPFPLYNTFNNLVNC